MVLKLVHDDITRVPSHEEFKNFRKFYNLNDLKCGSIDIGLTEALANHSISDIKSWTGSGNDFSINLVLSNKNISMDSIERSMTLRNLEFDIKFSDGLYNITNCGITSKKQPSRYSILAPETTISYFQERAKSIGIQDTNIDVLLDCIMYDAGKVIENDNLTREFISAKYSQEIKKTGIGIKLEKQETPAGYRIISRIKPIDAEEHAPLTKILRINEQQNLEY